jgi:hypothetical protein
VGGVATPALRVTYYGTGAGTDAAFPVADLLQGGEEDVGGDTDGQMYLDSSDYELMHDGAGEQVSHCAHVSVRIITIGF